MALKNTVPVRTKFNLLTRAGVSAIKSLPFGGAVGVVTAGAILWLSPASVPEGWASESFLSLGMGAGMVVHRVVETALGWILEPMRRHLAARWEAWIQLRKLNGYRERGLIRDEDAEDLAGRIIKADVTGKRRRRG